MSNEWYTMRTKDDIIEDLEKENKDLKYKISRASSCDICKSIEILYSCFKCYDSLCNGCYDIIEKYENTNKSDKDYDQVKKEMDGLLKQYNIDEFELCDHIKYL